MKRKHGLSLLVMLIAVVCACTVFVFAGCNCSKKKGNSSAITLSQTTLNIVEGGTGTVVATYNGSETIEWEIEDDSVATISSPTPRICTVTAVKVGTTTLTAKAGDDKATCTVKVSEDNTEKVTITLDGTAVTETSVEKGATKTLVATASQGSAIEWLTSNAKIVEVDEGVIKGINKGTATVTAQVTASIKAEVTVTVTGDGEELIPIEVNTETWATTNPGNWAYYADSWVTVSEAYSMGTEEVSITFSNNASDNPAYFYATQLFYKNGNLEAGKVHKLTFEAETTQSGRITLNGNVINLEEGKHEYTTYYTQGAGSSFGVQFGVNGIGMEIEEGTITFYNIQWTLDETTEKLVAPTFEYNNTSGVITFTDSVNAKGSVGGYMLYFYDNSDVVGSTYVVSGEVVDLRTIPNGTWTAKLVVIGANVHYINSDPSTTSVSITVENEVTQLTNGGEHDAYINPGKWIEWHDQGWNGSTVTLNDAYIRQNGSIYMNFAVSGDNQFGEAVHLYYHYGTVDKENGTFVVGKAYTITMKLKASAACTVKICGELVELKEGDNDIDVTFLHPEESLGYGDVTIGATIRIYFNTTGEFELSDINVVEAQQIQLTAPSFEYDAQSKVISIIEVQAEKDYVGSYKLGFFAQDGTGDPIREITVKTGDTVDPNEYVTEGTYALKIKAVGAGVLYIDSVWSDVITTVTSSSANVSTDLEFSEEKDTAFTSGWRYWYANWGDGNVAVQECYIDGSGDIHLTYTGSYWEEWGMQLFYKTSNPRNEKITIHSSVNGIIKVCGQKVTLVANQNVIVYVPSSYVSGSGYGSHIDIQFGYGSGEGCMLANGGTFVLSFDEYTPVPLNAPSFSLAPGNVITITDTVNSAGTAQYELGFFKGSELSATVAVENNTAVDLSTVPGGTYTVKLRAVGVTGMYVTSDWSTTEDTITVGAQKVDIAYGAEADFESGWRYWNEVEVNECYIDVDGSIHLTFSNPSGGGNWWAMQLFYKGELNNVAHKLTLTINSSVAGRIKINGVEKDLVVGDNSITVDNYGGSSISLQLGSESAGVLSGGTFVLKNISITAA